MRLQERIWNGWLRRPYKLSKTIDTRKGEQIILLIHGLGASSESWAPLIKELKGQNFRIIAYDLLGFGASPEGKTSDYSTEAHAKSIALSFKRDFGSRKKPVILIGHSMGCIISSKLVHKGWLRVSRLILYEPPLLTPTRSERKNIYKGIYAFLSKSPNLVITYSKLMSKRSKKSGNFDINPDNWRAFELSLKNTILGQTTLFELQNTKTPTDIIYGSYDFVVSRAQAKNLIAVNPNIVLHKVSEIHDISPRAGRFIKKILKTTN